MSEHSDRGRDALAAVVDPVLFQTLGELGAIVSFERSALGLRAVLAVASEEYP